MGLTKSQKADYDRFYVAKPDPSFNPDRARAVINGTIKKYETERKRRVKDFEDKLGERTDAVATYLTSLTGSGKPVEKYFGRRELAKLQGKKILEKLKWVNGQRVVTFENI